MRVVGGIHRSRQIKMVDVSTTRETQDHIREAVFNMIGKIDGHILDLFSGSGAYGIEALSRGASNCVFNDHHKKAYLTIKDNINALNLNEQSTVYQKDAFKLLDTLNDTFFDYIFVDPPYDFSQYQALFEALVKFMHQASLVIFETDKKTDIKAPGEMVLLKDKVYGYKRIRIYQLYEK